MKVAYQDIELIPWKQEYAVKLTQIANNPKIEENLRDGFPQPYTVDDAASWISSILPENDPPRFFAICYDNTLAGSIGLVLKDNVYRKNIETGYFLEEDLWGRGIMTKAIKAAVTYAFSQFEVVRIYAEVYADNTGSRRALEKAGFSCEAIIKKNIIKRDVINDSCIYSVLRENFKPADILIIY